MLQDDAGYRGKTTLLITTDHGRGRSPEDWTSHGDSVDGADEAWIAVLGPGAEALARPSEAGELTLGQVAATLAELVGEDYAAAVAKAAKPL